MDELIARNRSRVPIELRLLAACCDYPANERSDGLIKHLVPEIEDWAEFARVAQRHQVMAPVHACLGENKTVPGEIRELWAHGVKRRASFSLLQAKETARLHEALAAAGIESLVMKGVPLGIRLYGSMIRKHSSDIDLLVRPESGVRAVLALQDEGYMPVATGGPMTARQVKAVSRHYKEIAMRNARGETVDLHWQLVDPAPLLAGIRPFDAMDTIAIDRVGSVCVMGEANEFAYLCAHAALSDWSRIKWLNDINALVSQRSDSAMDAFISHAKRLGAGVCAAQALTLRAIFWDKPVPAALRGQLDPQETEQLFEYAIERMSKPHKPVSDTDRVERKISSARAHERLFPKSSVFGENFRASLFAMSDIVALPLPRWLDWLYIPLRPVFWLKRRIIPDELRQIAIRNYDRAASDQYRGE